MLHDIGDSNTCFAMLQMNAEGNCQFTFAAHLEKYREGEVENDGRNPAANYWQQGSPQPMVLIPRCIFCGIVDWILCLQIIVIVD